MTTLSAIDRPLDLAEAFFFLLDRLAGMNFVVFAERRAPLDAARLRAALDAVQRQEPLLDARIVWTPGASELRFERGAGAPLPLEVVDTDADGWLAHIEREMAQPFDAAAAPLARCRLLQWPGRSVVALTFHHCVGDGRSGADLLRRVLEHAAGAAIEPTPAPPLPPLHAALPPAFDWERQPEAAERVYDALMQDFRRHGKPARLPWLDAQSPRREPRVLRRTLAADALERLAAAARAQGSTVHGALCAAQLVAIWRELPERVPAPLFISCPVDLRAHLAPPQPVAPSALLVTMLSASFMVGPDTAFWALAREVTAHTRRQLARGDGHLFFCLYGIDAALAGAEGLARFDKMTLATPHGPCVSNIGRVPAVADPAVESMSFALCATPYQPVFTAATTYGGTLVLNLSYDAGKAPPARAQAIADSMAELLAAAADG